MKFKKFFILIYSFTIFYCYNVFAIEGSKSTSNDLSLNDKIIIVILFWLLVILIEGFIKLRELRK